MFTILGATGFIGSRLASELRAQGAECLTPGRGEPGLLESDLGHVIDCIGVNDFMERPEAAIEAHAGHLVDLLGRSRFDSFLYLSSARVYRHAAETSEDAPLPVDPAAAIEFFNLGKLLGESLCLGDPRPAVRVARLSNVYGDEQLFEPPFLPTLIRDAVAEGRVTLSLSPKSAKDYVSVADVAWLLPRIAGQGRRRIYNVASGRNVANGELIEALKRLTGCRVDLAAGAPEVTFPTVRIDRAREEFGFAPAHLLDELDGLVATARTRLEKKPQAARR
jgi:nucleoside-diphosphate-sugar epimerase